MAHDDPVVLRRAVDAAARGAFTIPISATFKLSEAAEAQNALAQARAGRSCWWSKPKREARLSAWEERPPAHLAHPCEEHLVPLMIVAGNLDR